MTKSRGGDVFLPMAVTGRLPMTLKGSVEVAD